MEFQRIHLDQVDSTNNYAAKWLRMTKSIAPTVITTSFQTQGKGQRTKSWQSQSSENLLATFILFPKPPLSEALFTLNKCIANAVLRVVQSFIPANTPIKIKWPNDIWVGNKKIAGILIENQWRGSHISSSIIGIGINVNQTQSLLATATSLALESKEEKTLKDILHQLIHAIQSEMEIHSTSSIESIHLFYKINILGLHQKVRYKRENEHAVGEIIDVNELGQLIIKTEDQQLLKFNHGEITVIYE
jgi:BirA family transcriptional regulator, biotin operon repressor / biotin---[acetyl-CoA-carboxylase] ligase